AVIHLPLHPTKRSLPPMFTSLAVSPIHIHRQLLPKVPLCLGDLPTRQVITWLLPPWAKRFLAAMLTFLGAPRILLYGHSPPKAEVTPSLSTTPVNL
ncbi:hypothetical protein V5O48_009924, partial [Marasmius crinis-equi]